MRRDTFERFDFLNSYIPGRSVTEMEFLYGALGTAANSTVVPERAFFYVRDDSFYDSIVAPAGSEHPGSCSCGFIP